jgi:prepilin-type processing-associated H-X9-DG protein
MEQGNVYDRLNLKYDWDYKNVTLGVDNLKSTQVDLALLVCASSPSGSERQFVSDYASCWRFSETAWEPLVNAKRITQRGPLNDDKWAGMLYPRTRTINSKVVEYRITTARIRDGLSNTIMLVECSARPYHYSGRTRQMPNITDGGHLWASDTAYFVVNNFCGTGQLMNCGNRDEIYSFHTGGCNFVFGDGSVRFLPETIDPETFVSLYTRDGGEAIKVQY